MTRRLSLLLSALVAALALSACGEKTEDLSGDRPPTTRLSLLLDYLPNADHAGIYLAREQGLFAKAGLEVDVRAPSDPATVLNQLTAGKVDLAISYQPEVLLARRQGKDVTAIASIVPKPLTSLISLPKAKISSPADLRGKTVGTAGIGYQTAYLRTILRKAGVDPAEVKQVNVGFNLNRALLSGKVDATLGAFWNYEGLELERADRKPSVTPVDELGVPRYDELVLVARSSTLNDKESGIRRLVRALANGYGAVRRDTAAATDALMQAAPDLDRGLQGAAIRRTVREGAFFPQERGKPWGWLSTDDWAEYGQWMVDNGLLPGAIPLDNVVTTDFLPGEGAGGEGRKSPSGAERPAQVPEGVRGP